MCSPTPPTRPDPTRFAEWQKGVIDAHMDRSGTPSVGDKWLTTRQIGFANRSVTAELRPLDPLLTDTRSRLTVTVDFRGRGIGRILLPLIVEREARTEMPANLSALKQRLETGKRYPSTDPKEPAVNTTAIRTAYDDLLAAAETPSSPPPPGEWDHDHLISVDANIIAVALAVTSGERTTYGSRSPTPTSAPPRSACAAAAGSVREVGALPQLRDRDVHRPGRPAAFSLDGHRGDLHSRRWACPV